MVSIRPDSHALRDFFTEGTRLEYKKGEYIIRPEETPPGVFYIEEGYVKSCNNTKYGEENMLVVRKSGEIFPLIWVVTGDSRKVAYVAHTDCVLYRRTQKELENFANQSKDALKEILMVTTIMYKSQAERVNSLVYRTVRERIAYFLKTLSRRFGVSEPGGVVIEIPLTRSDIAASVSATRETVSREFSALTRKGIVKQSNGRIMISDTDALDKIIE